MDLRHRPGRRLPRRRRGSSDYGPEALDRAENTMRLLAERTALAAWDCCHFAVLINLTA